MTLSSIPTPAANGHGRQANGLDPHRKAALVLRRLAAARAGLVTGRYEVARLGEVAPGTRSWQVGHAGAAYDVRLDEAARVWSCDCPDFEMRGRALATCKQIFIASLSRDAERRANQLLYRLLVGAAADELAARLPAAAPSPPETAPGEMAAAVASLTRAVSRIAPEVARAVRAALREALAEAGPQPVNGTHAPAAD